MYKFVTLLPLLLVFSCNTNDSQKNNEISGPSSLKLTETVCVDFAQSLHESFVNKDSTFLDKYLDWKSIGANILQKFPNEDLAIAEGIWYKMTGNIQVAKDFMNVKEQGGALRFITYYHNTDQHHIVLRTYYPPMHVNYYDFLLTAEHNTLLIKDIYSFEKACSLDVLLEEQLQAYLNKAKKNGKLDYIDTVENLISQCNSLVMNGNILEAYGIYTSIDTPLRQTQFYSAFELSLLSSSGNTQVQFNALKKRLDSIPVNEKGRWLIQFYKSSIAQNFVEARLALTKLKTHTGEDDILNFLYGMTYFEEGNLEVALPYFNDALATENELFSIHYAKVITLIELKQYVEAVEALLIMDDYFDMSTVDWEAEFNTYTDFLDSYEYTNWSLRSMKPTVPPIIK